MIATIRRGARGEGEMTAAGAQLDERRRLLRLLRREPSPEELARYHRHRLRLLVRHQALRRSTAKPVIRY